MNKTKTTALIIMDGWGVANPKNKGNPINAKNAPHYFNWLKKYSHTTLEASGEHVGLFAKQEGNSEAGHLNLGAGRVVKQDALYISDAINDGTFFKNHALLQAVKHAKNSDSAIHVMGLMSNHNSAHSVPEHLFALFDLFKEHGLKKIYLHLFTDGRDSGQHDAVHHLKIMEKNFHGSEKIVTIMGRFYAMDRGKNWERTQKAYEAMVSGKNSCVVVNAEEALTFAYNRGDTDEFICPSIVLNGRKKAVTIKNNDSIIFFNLRSDRARQLAKAFVQPDFEKINPGAFKRSVVLKNIKFVAMSDFGPDLPNILSAFPSRDIVNSLPKVLCPKRQLYIAESEKFAHVTYFFNGGFAHHFCDERWTKIDSVKIDNYADKPEMNAKVLADYLVKSIESGEYEFICANFANPDMVGHTGNMLSAEKAVQTVDKEVERVIQALIKHKGQAIITADHGNIERMINLKTGEVNTEHTTNVVPMILVGKKIRLKSGRLADVAPTILKLMGVKKPKDMSGKPLF